MGKGRRRKHPQAQEPITQEHRQKVLEQQPSTTKPFLVRAKTGIWAAILGGGALLAYVTLYPQLSINQDFTFDSQNAYNESFSIMDEGLLPLTRVGVTCTGDFVMKDAKTDFSGTFGTSTDYPNVAKTLTYKHRVSLPCNHNVVANGHSIEPGAKLGMKVHYRILELPIGRPQAFSFKAIAGADGQLHWVYVE